MSHLFKECNEPEGVSGLEARPLADVVKCKAEVMSRLATSKYQEPRDYSGTACSATWDPQKGGQIVVAGPKDCDQYFPTKKRERLAMVRQAAIFSDLAWSLSSADDFATSVHQMYVLCDSGTFGDPAACKKKYDALLKTADVVRTGNDCQPALSMVDGKLKISVGVNSDNVPCQLTLPEGEAVREKALAKAAAEYQRTVLLQGTTNLAEALNALYASCDSAGGDTEACKRDANEFLKRVQVLRTGKDCAARSSMVSGQPSIVVGENCTAFPDRTAREGKLTEAEAQYQRTVLLQGATSLGQALNALYAFCDSGAGGEPATCKQQSNALLTDVQIVRTGTSCAAKVVTKGEKPTIVVGPDCSSAFPENVTERVQAVQQGATQYVPPNPPPQTSPSAESHVTTTEGQQQTNNNVVTPPKGQQQTDNNVVTPPKGQQQTDNDVVTPPKGQQQTDGAVTPVAPDDAVNPAAKEAPKQKATEEDPPPEPQDEPGDSTEGEEK